MGLFNEISPFGRNDNGIVIPSMTPTGTPGLGLAGRDAWPTGSARQGRLAYWVCQAGTPGLLGLPGRAAWPTGSARQGRLAYWSMGELSQEEQPGVCEGLRRGDLSTCDPCYE